LRQKQLSRPRFRSKKIKQQTVN